jgi:hypothetical protein
MRRPSPAIAISTAALFIALSGTAYAATGGNFILGKSNTATSVSSLTNSAGTALSLSSKAGTPPLTVNNSAQVPKLNASLLGGNAASAFVYGGGDTQSGHLHQVGPTSEAFIVGTYPDSSIWLDGQCDIGGGGTALELDLHNSTGQTAVVEGITAGVGGSGQAGTLNATVSTGAALISGPTYGDFPLFETFQVIVGSRVVTFSATQYQTPGTGGNDNCYFWAQLLDNK